MPSRQDRESAFLGSRLADWRRMRGWTWIRPALTERESIGNDDECGSQVPRQSFQDLGEIVLRAWGSHSQ